MGSGVLFCAVGGWPVHETVGDKTFLHDSPFETNAWNLGDRMWMRKGKASLAFWHF